MLPHQSVTIYASMKEGVPETAREIAARLGLLPNAVYRAMEPLVTFGFVKADTRYPVRFTAVSAEAGLKNITGHVGRQLGAEMNVHKPHNIPVEPTGTTIDNREALLLISTAETAKTKKTIDKIISGHEAPAETVLANKQAIDRGVRIRTLVHQRNSSNEELLHNWARSGIEVRVNPSYKSARLFIFDTKIALYASYDPENRKQAIGELVHSEALCGMLTEMFEDKWNRAEPIC